VVLLNRRASQAKAPLALRKRGCSNFMCVVAITNKGYRPTFATALKSKASTKVVGSFGRYDKK